MIEGNRDSFRLYRVDGLECRVADFDWSFEREYRARIDAHWRAMKAQKPGLFDGRVYLTCNWSIEEDGGRTILRSQHFETGFKSFLAWLEFGPRDGMVCNSFAAAAVRGSDGGFLLGEMGGHTANAGQLYFPCGTPDRSDVADSVMDLTGSVFRELAEETGLAAPVIKAGNQWTIIAGGPYLACLLDIASVHTAGELARHASDFLAREERPELSGVHCVHGLADMRPDRMPAYIQTFFAAQFQDAQQQ